MGIIFIQNKMDTTCPLINIFPPQVDTTNMLICYKNAQPYNILRRVDKMLPELGIKLWIIFE